MSDKTEELSDGYHTMNELYDHRNHLMLLAMSMMPKKAWISWKHHDGTGYDGWFIAGVDLEHGTITYHMKAELWDLAVGAGAEVLEVGKEWDGHTPEDVLVRIASHIQRIPF